MTRSYNEKHDFWEPLIEPVDGFLRHIIRLAVILCVVYFTHHLGFIHDGVDVLNEQDVQQDCSF